MTRSADVGCQCSTSLSTIVAARPRSLWPASRTELADRSTQSTSAPVPIVAANNPTPEYRSTTRCAADDDAAAPRTVATNSSAACGDDWKNERADTVNRWPAT